MIDYVIIFLLVAVPALASLYFVIKTKNNKVRMPRVASFKSATEALTGNINPDVTNHVLKHTLGWVEVTHGYAMHNIDKIALLEERILFLEKLTNKMSVIVLNKQEENNQGLDKPEGIK